MFSRLYSVAALGVCLLLAGSAQAITLNPVNVGVLTHSDPHDTVRVNSHRKVYTGFLQAGKSYVFELKSVSFDPFLRLETSGGVPLAADDDSGFGLNSKIKFTPKFSGTYRVIVTTFKADATGPYVLNYSSWGGGGGGVIPGTLWLHPGSNFSALTHSDPHDTIRTQSHRKVFLLNANAGNSYVLTMESGQFDTYLRVEDMSGQVLKVDDDSGKGLNARIVFQPNFSGTFRVIATSFAPDKTGNFDLKMGVLASPIAGQVIHGALTFGDPVDPSGHRFDIHSHFLMAGKTYTIRMNSPTFDTFLKLRNSAGFVVAANDDGGPGLNSQITFTPPVSGMYQIVATSYKAGATGNYTVTIMGN